MWYISEHEYETRLGKIKKKNDSKERRRKLKEEKNKYSFQVKLPSTSKIILLAVFLLCIEVVVYCEYAMLVLGDTSAMYVLIGIPATLVPTILAYYSKSKSENVSGGIVYDMAMKNQDAISDEDAKG